MVVFSLKNESVSLYGRALLESGAFLKNLDEAVSRAQVSVLRDWYNLVRNANPGSQFDIPGWKENYLRGLHADRRTKPYVATVSVEKTKFVAFVEKGIKSYDMKPGLLAGRDFRVIWIPKKTPNEQGRQSKFRQMPKSIYDLVSKGKGPERFKSSKVIGTTSFGKRVYSWGSRLGKDAVSQANEDVRKYAGMVKMKAKGRSHTYGTFRVVTRNPPEDPAKRARWQQSWHYPKIPGARIFPDKLTRESEAKVRKILAAGLERDVRDIADKIQNR